MFKVGDTVRQVKQSNDAIFNVEGLKKVVSANKVAIYLQGYGLLGFDPGRFEVVPGTTLAEGSSDCPENRSESVRQHSSKDTNPKDAVGTKKPPMSVVSAPVLMELGTGMLEGALKYGRHNYRVSGVRASVYYDASMRHLMRYWEGEDIDPDSGLSHITKAIASLVVLRDAQINNKCVDDRPPVANPEWFDNVQEVVDELIEKYPKPEKAFTINGE